MKQTVDTTILSAWREEHPWIAQLENMEEEDTIEEVLRFSLDELRFS